MVNHFVYAGNPDTHLNWKFIPDTPEAKQQAIADGYNAFSVYSFEFEPTSDEEQNHGRQPKRYGDLWMDIDSKENPSEAIAFVREFVQKLAYHVKGFSPAMLQYYLSGGKGCHIRIPAKMFGGEEGDTHLPEIHKEMLKILLGYLYSTSPVSERQLNNSLIDTNMYKMGKGQLLREENIKRSDGKYKVEVSCNDFLELESNELLTLTSTPNNEEIVIQEAQKTDLEKFFRKALIVHKLFHSSSHSVRALHKCEFVRHCLTNSYSLSYPHWFLMMCILNKAKAKVELAHDFSEDYPKYTPEETQKVFSDAAPYAMPACAKIKEVFECPANCKCESVLNRAKNPDSQTRRKDFENREDGLYMLKSKDGEVTEEKIGSPISVLGRIKAPESNGWGIVVEIKDSSGKQKKVILPITDLVGKGDVVIGKLCDLGFMPEDRNKYLKEILDYVYCQNPEELYIRVEKIGWYDKERYILPDKTWCNNTQIKLFFDASENLFTSSGTLEEWQTNIGKYCQGNSLAMFVCAYALIGVLLEQLGIESCGLHFDGPSSIGKTTLVLVGGSVCGGHSQRGFIRQWNATANAIEKIAALHNDNLLVLDEVGQANSDAVAIVAYLLSNSQGKTRMKQDASLREISTWRIAFLSTGEMSFGDKIEQNGKNKTMAGQEIRVISLPADAKNGENIFSDTHDLESSQEVSSHLQKMTKKFWGTPLRAFLDALFRNNDAILQENLKLISNDLTKFLDENVPPEANGQVFRVAKRFGLIAAAGNFACKNNIFTWTTDENWAAIKKWFQIWLNERGGVESLEVAKAIEKLDGYIELYQFTRFVPLSSQEDIKRIPNFTGYRAEDEKTVYMQPAILKNIIGKAYFEQVLKTLDTCNRLELDSNGSWIIFKQIYKPETETNRSMRLIGIRVKNPPIKNEEKKEYKLAYPTIDFEDNVF